MKTLYGTGCLPYEKNEKDYIFQDLINCVGDYPKKYISPLPAYRLDQGSSSMCVGFALSMARYLYEIKDSGNTDLFSPAYIYSNRKNTDYKGEGMITRQALDNLVSNGVCYLKNFSDIGDYQTLNRKYVSRRFLLDEEAHPYRISSYYLLNTDNEIKQSVITTGFAVASYDVYDNWYATTYDGKVKNNYGKNYGGHCILIVGWTENDEWIILNSWGNAWGDNGLGYVPMKTFKNEAWCVLDYIQETFFTSLKDIQNHWAISSINKAVNKGIIQGYEDLTFRPDNGITRAEACAIISKINGYNGEDTINVFSDVANNSWYKNYIGYCRQRNFISGYTDGTFKPMNNLARAEAAKILCLVSGIKCIVQNKQEFNDVDHTHWAFNYISTLKEKGIINGYEDGSFKPDNPVTRAEFIVMVDRLGLLS
ncbi:MAG: S-layer homology domain-containing protein [Oscillospiraceae bacterium]|nr:S-layer homology domain-containing protein [Oscillospiraceae bacterium]